MWKRGWNRKIQEVFEERLRRLWWKVFVFYLFKLIQFCVRRATGWGSITKVLSCSHWVWMVILYGMIIHHEKVNICWNINLDQNISKCNDKFSLSLLLMWHQYWLFAHSAWCLLKKQSFSKSFDTNEQCSNSNYVDDGVDGVENGKESFYFLLVLISREINHRIFFWYLIERLIQSLLWPLNNGPMMVYLNFLIYN